MELDQVIGLIHDRLRVAGKVSYSELTDDMLMLIARNVWIEHRALPELPVTSIADRWISGPTTDEERRFWHRQGLL
jgi:hypothetical protein